MVPSEPISWMDIDSLTYAELERMNDQGEILVPPYKGWMIYRYPRSKMHLYVHYVDHPGHDGMPCGEATTTTCKMCNVAMPMEVREHLHTIYKFIYHGH